MSSKRLVSLIAKEHGKFLAKKGYPLSINPPSLGSGARGEAFDIGNNIVLKVTTDASEAAASKQIVGKQLKHVNQIYDVFKVPDSHKYIILQKKLNPLSKAQLEMYQLADALTEHHHGFNFATDGEQYTLLKNNRGLIARDLKQELDKDYAKMPNNKKKIIVGMAMFIFDAVFELKQHGIDWADSHKGNVLLDGDKFKVIDLGASRAPDADIDVLENIRNTIQRILTNECRT
jgi:hypothetical protein